MRLCVGLGMLLSKIHNFVERFQRKISSSHGYVLLVVAVFVPVAIAAMKYILALRAKKIQDIYTKGDDSVLFKRCSRDVALEVAKKWNPALTLGEQKAALLRIADKIYNESPTYHFGVQGSSVGAETDGVDSSPNAKQITMKTITPTYAKVTASGNARNKALYNLYCAVYKASTSDGSVLINYDSDEITGINENPAAICDCFSGEENITAFIANEYVSNNTAISAVTTTDTTLERTEYSERSNADDTKLQLSVKDDKIKVVVNSDVNNDDYLDVCYAEPASCNVDIVLSIPTNMAACNPDNCDTNSPTAGARVDGTSENYSLTPIYVIRSAYQKFLKEFMFTRGVSVGLIPYDSSVGLPADKVTSWTVDLPTFSEDFPNSPFIRRSCLFATNGTKGENLSMSSIDYTESMNNIFAQAGKVVKYENYGNNYILEGDILSTVAPTNTKTFASVNEGSTNSANTLDKFVRQWYKPCEKPNLLSMTSESETSAISMQPFHVVELTPDLNKVFNLLSVIGPHNGGRKSVSNFVFLPITWANNLFQSWTADKSREAADTGGSESGRLSVSSKSSGSGKKALILVVNKPDFFKENELTYIGYNNDYSEIPMTESDKICFDINYKTDNIQGVKGILKCTNMTNTSYDSSTGYYQTDEDKVATCTLTFPRKHLIKLVVAPKFSAENSGRHEVSKKTTFTFKGDNNGPLLPKNDEYGLATAATSTRGPFGRNLSPYKVKYKLENAKITACTLKKQVLRDYCGQYGRDQTDVKPLILRSGMTATRSDYGAFNAQLSYGITGNLPLYSSPVYSQAIHEAMDPCVSIINSPVCDLVATRVEYMLHNYVIYQVNGIAGNQAVCLYSASCNRECFRGGGPITRHGEGTYLDWCWKCDTMSPSSTTRTVDGIAVDDNNFVVKGTTWNYLETYFLNATSTSDETGYKELNKDTNPTKNSGIYLLNNWICFNGDGILDVTVEPESNSGYITFYDDNRLTSSSITVKGKTYVITDEKEIYIDPDDISGSDDTGYSIQMTMERISLISAEITNRAYTTKSIEVAHTTVPKGSGTIDITINDKRAITAKSNLQWNLKRDSIIFDSTNQNEAKGRNGILTYSGSSETGKFSFTTGKLLKLVVEPDIEWTECSSNLNTVSSAKLYSYGRMGTTNNVMQAIFDNGDIAETLDGLSWELKGNIVVPAAQMLATASTDDSFITTIKLGTNRTETTKEGWRANGAYNMFIGATKGKLRFIINGVVCNTPTVGAGTCTDKVLCVENGLFVHGGCTNHEPFMADLSKDFYREWDNSSTKPTSLAAGLRILGYGNGRWIYGDPNNLYYSDDNCETLTALENKEAINEITGGYYGFGAPFVNDRFYVISNGHIVTSEDGITWKSIKSDLKYAENITYFKGCLWAYCPSGNRDNNGNAGTCIKGEFGEITFSNASKTTEANKKYAITGKKTFYFDVTSPNDLSFTMKNVRLVSAEIVNDIYTTITPECSLSGTTSGTGTCTIKTNVTLPMQLKVKMKKEEQPFVSSWTSSNTDVMAANCKMVDFYCDEGKAYVSGKEDDKDGTFHKCIDLSTGSEEKVISYGDSNSYCFGIGNSGEYITIKDGNVNLGKWGYSSGISSEIRRLRKLNGKVFVCGDDGVVGTVSETEGTKGKITRYALEDTSFKGSFIDMCYGNGIYAVVSNDRCYMCSDLSKAWIGYTPGITGGKRIVYGNNAFVFLGENGKIVVFSDKEGTNGKVSFVTDTIQDENIADVIYSDSEGLFYAITANSTDNKLFVSSDGKNWGVVGSQIVKIQGNSTANWTQEKLGYYNDKLYLLAHSAGSYDYKIFSCNINKPVQYDSPYISYYNAISKKTIYNGFVDDQTITIDPKSYQYVGDDSSGYTITLNLRNVEVSDLQYIDDQGICSVSSVQNPIDGYIEYETPDGTKVQQYAMLGENIEIDPKTHKYVDQGNGTYKITLEIVTSVDYDESLTDIKAVDSDPVYSFSNPMPENAIYVDFSKNSSNAPYVSDAAYLQTSSSLSWDSDKDSWKFVNAPGTDSATTSVSNIGTFVGDFSYLINFSNHNEVILPEETSTTELAGLYRKLYLSNELSSYNNVEYKISDADSNPVYPILASYTLPINTMLYYGGYYTDSSATFDCDPNNACARVTTAAYAKLKEDYGDNLRVYVIKYNPQTSYIPTGQKDGVPFDYSYIDACASSEQCVYTVSNAVELEEVMKKIAADIKTFAGYEKAKVVIPTPTK